MDNKNKKQTSTNKTAELLLQAEEGIKEFLTSDKYKQYLRVMSKFHNYSVNNTILILTQNPNATRVAGYKTWKNSFNRQVNKGEKSIKIIGGRPYKRKVEEQKNGKKEEKVIEGISFFPVSVFDVSQTSGDPLPELMNDVSGDVKDYSKLYVALKQYTDFTVEFADLRDGLKGYCAPLEKKIVINNGMSQAHTIKTLIHEIAHADLHAPEFDEKNNPIRKTSTSTREVEAESTAFVVCEHFGIDTKDYSFPYLASWSSDKEIKELKNSFEVILKQANTLIQKVEKNLEELQLEVTPSKEEKQSDLSLSEKLEAFEDKAKALNEQREKEKILNTINQQREQNDVSTLQ